MLRVASTDFPVVRDREAPTSSVLLSVAVFSARGTIETAMPDETRSSISDPTQPSALTRAKQAAVLHNRVIVELGFYDVALTDHGGVQWWTPPDQITPEQVVRARNPPEDGR
jgi:hypothetical protein